MDAIIILLFHWQISHHDHPVTDIFIEVYSLRYMHWLYSSIVFIDKSLIDRSITTNIGWSSPKDYLWQFKLFIKRLNRINLRLKLLHYSNRIDLRLEISTNRSSSADQSPLSPGWLITTIIDTQRHRVTMIVMTWSIWDLLINLQRSPWK